MFKIGQWVRFIPEMVADRCYFSPCIGYEGRIVDADDRGVVMVHFEHSGYPMPIDFVMSVDRLALVDESSTQHA